MSFVPKGGFLLPIQSLPRSPALSLLSISSRNVDRIWYIDILKTSVAAYAYEYIAPILLLMGLTSFLTILEVAHLILAGPISCWGDWRLVFFPINVSIASKSDRSVETTSAFPPDSCATPSLSSLWEIEVRDAVVWAHHAYSCNIRYRANRFWLQLPEESSQKNWLKIWIVLYLERLEWFTKFWIDIWLCWWLEWCLIAFFSKGVV